MVNVGRINTLKVRKKVSFGLYLEGEQWGEILLPTKFVPEGIDVGDDLEVFVYFDSEDKIIATTQRPRVQLGKVACLKVVDLTHFGAFLDWGLDKDLLAPKLEQQRPMERDKYYLVYVKQDNQQRLIASSKLDYFLDKSLVYYQPGEEVSIMIAEATNLGVKVIINHQHWGLIHSADIFQSLSYGKKMRGYIKSVREDGKIDVVLRKVGQANTVDVAQRILHELQNNQGFLPLHDKSAPQEILLVFNDSKKNFKSAIGQLYKQGKISIESNGIRIVQN